MRAVTWAVPVILIAVATEITNEGGSRGDKGMAQKYGYSTEWDNRKPMQLAGISIYMLAPCRKDTVCGAGE